MKHLKRILITMLAIILTFSSVCSAFAAVNDIGFTDVAVDDWYTEAVIYCRDNGLMTGTGDTEFSPNASMTRSMLAAVLYRLEGSPVVSGSDNFTDTVESAWYADAVLWASQNGIVGGYNDALFGAEDPVTREQLAAILWRYAGSPHSETKNVFSDEREIADYAIDAVNWARSNGYISGIEGNRFAPDAYATRAEIAAILTRFVQKTQIPSVAESIKEKNVLVAYFSATGTTKNAAQEIITALGSDVADLYEITPETLYTTVDLDYSNPDCRSVREQHDSVVRPAILGEVKNMEQYDIVFLGYPIWNNDAPRIIYTFLENEEMNGKTIIPFCTSGGSDISNSVSNIRNLADDATWLEGYRCTNNTAALENWIKQLELNFAINNETASGEQTSDNLSEEPQVLVAYFSATNNTEKVAQYIANDLKAECYKIMPAVPYTDADLDYGNDSSRTTIEMNNPAARPKILGSVENMEDYDIIFLGYPIWWGEAPRIINTFLESYDFSGKTIVPFCTSNSSGIGNSDYNLHSLANNADWLEGQRFSAGTSETAVADWLDRINLD